MGKKGWGWSSWKATSKSEKWHLNMTPGDDEINIKLYEIIHGISLARLKDTTITCKSSHLTSFNVGINTFEASDIKFQNLREWKICWSIFYFFFQSRSFWAAAANNVILFCNCCAIYRCGNRRLSTVWRSISKLSSDPFEILRRDKEYARSGWESSDEFWRERNRLGLLQINGPEALYFLRWTSCVAA